MTRNPLKAASLAGLDAVYRSGGFFTDVSQKPTRQEVSELQQLYALVPWKKFKPKKYVVFNPWFGEGSKKVGGADADFIVDTCLIELKTTKEMTKVLGHVRQLVGYALTREQIRDTSLN